MISLILRKKVGLSEYAISDLLGVHRTNVYHCVETAKREIELGRLEYIESLENWQEALAIVPLSGVSNFSFALSRFIEIYCHSNKVTDEDIIKAIEQELTSRQ